MILLIGLVYFRKINNRSHVKRQARDKKSREAVDPCVI